MYSNEEYTNKSVEEEIIKERTITGIPCILIIVSEELEDYSYSTYIIALHRLTKIQLETIRTTNSYPNLPRELKDLSHQIDISKYNLGDGKYVIIEIVSMYPN